MVWDYSELAQTMHVVCAQHTVSIKYTTSVHIANIVYTDPNMQCIGVCVVII